MHKAYAGTDHTLGDGTRRATRTAIAPTPPATAASDERFHVQFAPGDVREVTLDQVDDLFRLGVIDPSTLLWAEGMDHWQTLGEAAGLGAAEVEPVKTSGSRRPPPPPRRASAAPAPARPSTAAPRAPTRSVAAAPRAVSASELPLEDLALVSPSVAPVVRESFDSVVFGDRRAMIRRRIQATLICASLLAGTVVTLYRNDLVFVWAQSLGQAPAYLALEKRWLGGAPKGTPREVDTWLGRSELAASAAAANGPSLLSAAVVKTPLTPDSPADDTATTGGAQAEPAAKAQATEDTAPKEQADEPLNPVAPDALPLAGGTPRSISAATQHRASPSARTAPTRTRRAPAEDAPSKASAKQEDTTAETNKPAPGPNDFLNASIRDAVEKSKKKKRGSKSKKDAYDPLNADF